MRIKISHWASILPLDQARKARGKSRYAYGVAIGEVDGRWHRVIVGTDDHGNDVPIVLLCESGHCVDDAGVRGSGVEEVRACYVPSTHTAAEFFGIVSRALAAVPHVGDVEADLRQAWLRSAEPYRSSVLRLEAF